MASLNVENTPPTSLGEINNTVYRQTRQPGEDTPDTYRESFTGTNGSGISVRNNQQPNNATNSQSSRSTRPSDTPITNIRYPNYKTHNERRATFRNFPASCKQDKERMIAAGFYYAENGDSVRCFYCGIGLRNWDPQDDPWVEHARWSQLCPHVIKMKGQGFIDRVQEAVREAERREMMQSNSVQDLTTDCPVPQRQNGEPTTQENHTQTGPSEMERKNPLLCDAAQSVISMGYLPRVVKSAVDELLKTEGWANMSGKKLLQIIMDKEERGEIDSEKSVLPKRRSEQIRRKGQFSPDPKSLNIEKLREENRSLKEKMMCKLCWEESMCIMLLPCGHLVSCAQCAPALKQCPICRQTMKATVRVSLK